MALSALQALDMMAGIDTEVEESDSEEEIYRESGSDESDSDPSSSSSNLDSSDLDSSPELSSQPGRGGCSSSRAGRSGRGRGRGGGVAGVEEEAEVESVGEAELESVGGDDQHHSIMTGQQLQQVKHCGSTYNYT